MAVTIQGYRRSTGGVQGGYRRGTGRVEAVVVVVVAVAAAVVVLVLVAVAVAVVVVIAVVVVEDLYSFSPHFYCFLLLRHQRKRMNYAASKTNDKNLG